MATKIKCNKCGNEIEITEAITKELEAKILKEIQAKHEAEIKALLEKQDELTKAKEREIEKVKLEISKKAEIEAKERIELEYESKIELIKKEARAREEQNKELQKQLEKLLEELRESKDVEGKLRLEYRRKLLEEQEKIKAGAKKEAEEELNLKILQKDKQLEDLKKQLEEARRKAEQGSQQMQGEVQELALEDQLREAFMYDDVKEVPKGIRGADVVQTVRTPFGSVCGTIVWESKNTKAWSNKWVSKLKDDIRTLKGDIPIIVSAVLPDEINSFGQIEGVWICDMKSSIPLAFALREQLIAIRNIKEANKGKNTKAEIVYNYLTSNEFKQRIEVWIEYFKTRKEEIDAERRYFTKKWSKEEKDMERVFQNTAGIYGDLQGLIGSALPKVQYLELPEDDDLEQDK